MLARCSRWPYFSLPLDLPSLLCITFYDEQLLYSLARTSHNHLTTLSFKLFEMGIGIKVKQGGEKRKPAYQWFNLLCLAVGNLTWAPAKKSWVSQNYANGSNAARVDASNWHCGDQIILAGRQNWKQIVKNLPKSCDPTVWNGKVWLGKIQTTYRNILPPHQNSLAPAVWPNFRLSSPWANDLPQMLLIFPSCSALSKAMPFATKILSSLSHSIWFKLTLHTSNLASICFQGCTMIVQEFVNFYSWQNSIPSIHPPILKLFKTMYYRVGYVTVFFFVFIGEV